MEQLKALAEQASSDVEWIVTHESDVADKVTERLECLAKDAFALSQSGEPQAEASERRSFANANGMTETYTFDEALEEIKRLGLRCEELYAQVKPVEPHRVRGVMLGEGQQAAETMTGIFHFEKPLTPEQRDYMRNAIVELGGGILCEPNEQGNT